MITDLVGKTFTTGQGNVHVIDIIPILKGSEGYKVLFSCGGHRDYQDSEIFKQWYPEIINSLKQDDLDCQNVQTDSLGCQFKTNLFRDGGK